MTEALLALAGSKTAYCPIRLHRAGHLRSWYKRHETGELHNAVILVLITPQPLKVQ